MQLELLNLLSAAPAASFSTPPGSEDGGFADILQQAQGLNLGELQDAVEFSIDVREPVAMASPGRVDDDQVVATLRSLLQAADIDLPAGMDLPADQDLPDLRELSALVEGLDLQALREQFAPRAVDEPVQQGLPFQEPVARLDLQQAVMSPELQQRLAELGEQVARWSASIAQMPTAEQGLGAATSASLTQLQQALRQVVDQLQQGQVANTADAPPASPVAYASGTSGRAALTQLVAGAQPMTGAATTAPVPSLSTPQIIEQLARIAAEVSGVQQPALAQQSHDSAVAQVPQVNGTVIANMPAADTQPLPESVAPRGAQLDIAPVRPLFDGDAGDRRTALNLRERLALDNQISLREVASSSGGLRDSAPLTNLDQMVRGVNGALEARTVSIDPTVTVPSSAARAETSNPVLASRVPLLADETTQVWVRNSEEVPERILQQVSRMHANALRLQAGGATDFVQRLTLQLSPAELGHVEVQLRATDQVSVTFTAREASTRDLLDAGVARLRQMFEEQGISLGDVEVGGHSSQREAQEGRDGRPGNTADSLSVDGDVPASVAAGERRADEGMLHVIA